MPIAQATTTKAAIREAVSNKLGDWWEITTTGAGSTTSVVSTSLTGYADDFFIDWYALMTSGSAASEWRRVTDSVQSTGTLTLDRALSAGSGSGSVCELHRYRPDLLSTQAPNEARFRAFPSIHKPEVDYVLSNGQAVYGVPRGMRKVWRVSQAQDGAKLNDRFDRADSTTTLGGSWVAGAGTAGIATEHLYFVSDTDGDRVGVDVDESDIIFDFLTRGTLASSTVYRTIGLKFRILEDYSEAQDNNNYLYVRLLSTTGAASGGVVDLRKMDRGTETSLTTGALTTSDGVDYRITGVAEGSVIRIFVDGIERITHRLDEPNLKYLDGKRVEFRLDKAGSPATAARVGMVRVDGLHGGYIEHHDWRQSEDDRIIEFGTRGRSTGLVSGRYLKFEGGDLLTAAADDTTPGTIASDTTAVFEIETTDPAWDVFAEFGAWMVWEKLALPGVGEPEDRAMYAKLAEAAERKAILAARANGMKAPTRTLQRPY